MVCCRLLAGISAVPQRACVLPSLPCPLPSLLHPALIFAIGGSVLWWEVARQQEKHAQDMEKKQQLHAAKEEVRQASVDAQAPNPPPSSCQVVNRAPANPSSPLLVDDGRPVLCGSLSLSLTWRSCGSGCGSWRLSWQPWRLLARLVPPLVDLDRPRAAPLPLWALLQPRAPTRCSPWRWAVPQPRRAPPAARPRRESALRPPRESWGSGTFAPLPRPSHPHHLPAACLPAGTSALQL